MYPKKENIKRMEEILGIFFHYGLDYLLTETSLLKFIPLTKRFKTKIKREAKIPLPVRVRRSFEELGPSFIKLGQLLSIRPDLVPYEFLVEFESMQDKGPKVPYQYIKERVEIAIKAPIKDVFLKFEVEPLASASLAQVHRAQLKNKEWVVVKVRRPQIKEQMERDLDVMVYLAKTLQKHFPNPYNLPKIVEEFRNWTEKEINFQNELVNAKIFKEHSLESKNYYIPHVYDAYCTEDILVSEYIDGISIHDIEVLKRKKYPVKKLLEDGCKALVTQVFDKGFFHADPHPGNVLVTKDAKIAFIDFGIVGQFDENLKRKSLELLWGITNNSPEISLSALYGINTNNMVKEPKEFERKIKQIMYPLQYTSLKELKITDALKNMFEACATHGISIPVDFILFGKTIITMEGIALRYDPDFSLSGTIGETLNDIMKKRYSAKEMYKWMKLSTLQAIDFMDELPRYAKDITDRLRSGKFTMDIDTSEVHELTNELEHSSGNLSMGLMISALLVSSTMLVQYQTYHTFAVIGYTISFLLAIWLIWHTIVHKR